MKTITSYSNYVKRTCRQIEETIRIKGKEGITKDDLFFYFKREKGVTERFVKKYIEELKQRQVIKEENNILRWVL